jgi:hypothetical protein
MWVVLTPPLVIIGLTTLQSTTLQYQFYADNCMKMHWQRQCKIRFEFYRCLAWNSAYLQSWRPPVTTEFRGCVTGVTGKIVAASATVSLNDIYLAF